MVALMDVVGITYIQCPSGVSHRSLLARTILRVFEPDQLTIYCQGAEVFERLSGKRISRPGREEFPGAQY